MNINTTRDRQRIKSSIDAFPKCPSCFSTNLSSINKQVFCGCGWNSIKAFVDAGGMDYLVHSNRYQSAIDRQQFTPREEEIVDLDILH